MKVLVLGAGAMGRNHVRNLSAQKEVDSILVVDPSQESLGFLRKEKYEKIQYFTELQEAISEKPVCAIVASPTTTHFENAMLLVKAGIHALVEKPITDSVENAKKLIREAEERKVILMVGHIERFNPAVQALKKNIGNIGKVVYASSHRFGIPTQRKLGDAFLDQAVHDIDVISYLTGEYPLEVQASEHKILEQNDGNDLCTAIFEFPSFTASVEANRVTPIKTRELIILGLKGSAKLDYITQDLTITHADSAVTKYNSFDEIVMRVGRGTELKPYFQKDEPLKLEIQHFLQCVEKDEHPIVNGKDGLQALAAVEAGIFAGKSGKKEKIRI